MSAPRETPACDEPVHGPARPVDATPETRPPPDSGLGTWSGCAAVDPDLRIPGYEVHEQIGMGGMGSVFRATHLATRREVALKVMGALSVSSERARARFDREVQITARLEHPNIARVYDSGVYHGTYFYAMELVGGLHLDRYVSENGLGRARVLALMRTVCRAVEYAHQNGVIHCDLKPGNVLVTPDGQPRVMDFGLARALSDTTAGAGVSVSGEGEVAGTPAFMSPEQAAGRNGRLDTRSDVYALGVILYHLLTGRSPHDLSGSRLELLRRISESDVVLHRRLGLGRELEALLLKALARDPARRYGSAGGLANDLDRYLSGEPLVAKRPTVRYVLGKRLKRHWPAAAGVAGLALLVAGGLVIDAARVRKERANALAGWKAAEEHARTSDLRLAGSLVAQGDALLLAGQWARARPLYAKARAVFEEVRGPTYAADLGLWDVERQAAWSSLRVASHADKVYGVAMTPDARIAVSGASDGSLKAWDPLTGRLIRNLRDEGPPVRGLAITSAGDVAVSADASGELCAWDLRGGKPPRSWQAHHGAATAVAVTPDGRVALSGAADGSACVWDLGGGRERRRLPARGGGLMSVAISGDGRTGLTGDDRGGVHAWDLGSGGELGALADGKARAHAQLVSAVALSADGRTAVSGSFDGLVKVWDVAAARLVRTLRSSGGGGIGGLAAAPDAARGDGVVFAGDYENTVTAWNLRTGELVGRLAGSQFPYLALATSPDGTLVLAGSQDERVYAWEFATDRAARRLAAHSGPAAAVAFSDDGLLAISGGADGRVRVWDVATGRPLRDLVAHRPGAEEQAFSMAGWYAGMGVNGVSFLGGSHLLASAGGDGHVRAWDLASGREVRAIAAHQGPAFDVALTPDGGRLLSAGSDGSLATWELATGREVRRVAAHARAAMCVTVSPDGRTAVTGGADKMVRVWDVETGRRLHELKGHDQFVRSAAITGDGRAVLTGSDDGVIRVWDLGTGRELRVMQGHTNGIRALGVTADGQVAISGSWDRYVRLWDLTAGTEMRALASSTHVNGGIEEVVSAAISPDGRVAIGGRWDGEVRLWYLGRAAERLRLEGRVAAARAVLAHSPGDPAATRALGEWLALQGVPARAIPLLTAARDAGETVPSLMLARCHWLSGDADAAAREFREAARHGEAPPTYLRLCLDAVERDALRKSRGDPSRPQPD